MPIEQNVKLNVDADTDNGLASPIENEIPAYRAVSSTAVFALILGVLSILSFASWYFLAFSALAIILGLKADRTIQRFPDMFTGRGLAQTGFGLGLIFGLTAFCIGTVQGVLHANEARKFAREIESTLKKGTVEDMLWIMQPPTRREGMTREKLAEEIRGKPGTPSPVETQLLMINAVRKAATQEGSELHFATLERQGEADMILFASAIFEIHSPQAKDPAERDRFALAFIKGGKTEKGQRIWWVDDLRFPYIPNSYVAPVKPVDDGHGHGAGDGHDH